MRLAKICQRGHARISLFWFVLVLALPRTAVAQINPGMIGTWKLNLAKSKYDPGPPPQSKTVIVERAGNAAKRTIYTVAADGDRTTQVDTAKFDGKDYPRTGSPYFDAVAMERIDASTWKTTLKKAGKAVGASSETLSPDGKVYTVTVTRIRAATRYRSIVEVFDKQ